MWDKLKQAKEMQKLQGELQKERFEEERNGVKLVMNGKMELVEVSLNEEISKEEQEKAVKECFNGVIRKVQMAAAQKMQSMR